MNTDSFALRHIGPRKEDLQKMLDTVGAQSMEELINQTIPNDIRLEKDLTLDMAMSEQQYLEHIGELATKNQVFKTYMGLGYHQAITPPVIQRNILENPGWYTAYTPYQAEIAQGRLEALLNYQTMITDLTGMELANASLLDESTAAAEAMALLFAVRERQQKKDGVNKFFVSEDILPQTLSLLQTRATPIGIELVIGDHEAFDFSSEFFAAILQYPGKSGKVYDFRSFVADANKNQIKIAVAADILSLVKLESPGSFGVDVVVGTTQRFGIPLGYGGPHAAYFATKEAYKRNIPGRIIGVTRDTKGNRALRMALQTREQHIKRDKATSNICTAQVLLAVMAGMYGVYHGPKGLTYIADKVHNHASTLASALEQLGLTQANETYFDTIAIKTDASKIKFLSESKQMNFYYPDTETVSISVNETTTIKDLNKIIALFAEANHKETFKISEISTGSGIPKSVARQTPFLENSVFNSYHSETELMRYIKKLERKDLALNHSMIALGSCTMKLNAAAEMLPLSNPMWGNMHPFVPVEQAAGYQAMLKKLEEQLTEITGFAGTSLQPNSGAQGEYAGLMVIRAYHESRNDHHRNICLIPSSAHGTNPASAVMAGMKVVVTKANEQGNIDVEDLRANAKQLVAFLPSNPLIETGGEHAITAISGAPWGSALACLISYAYICMLGENGLKKSTQYAILNANYIKERLDGHYDVLYAGEKGRAAHEMIIDCRPFKEHGIEVVDIAKRLMDYGFHAPTVSFPVAGTMMIEPTESESLQELDRFCDAMISIGQEINATSKHDTNNVLKNAPHTQALLTADSWDLPYTRQQAAFPLAFVSDNKFWPSVARVDDAYGDRNLICTCAPIEQYMED